MEVLYTYWPECFVSQSIEASISVKKRPVCPNFIWDMNAFQVKQTEVLFVKNKMMPHLSGWVDKWTKLLWKCMQCFKWVHSDWPCQHSGGWWSPGSSCWSVRGCWSGLWASVTWSGRLPRPLHAWWRTRHPGCSWCLEDSGITRKTFISSLSLNLKLLGWILYILELSISFLSFSVCFPIEIYTLGVA